jgi:hypothetical protein
MHLQTSQNQQVSRKATNGKMGNTLLSHTARQKCLQSKATMI